MEFATLPRRSPRFPHSPNASGLSSSSHAVAANVAANATGVASSSSGLRQSYSHHHTSAHHQEVHQEEPADEAVATAPTIPSNRKRPRLTLDLPSTPKTPTGLSPRDIRALKRRKLLHPGSPTPSTPPSPTAATNGNAVAGPSNATPTSSPLTSPTSAIPTPRSSTPPPPPSMPPLIQPTSAHAVRPERRKKLGFESSPLSRNSTTPTTPTTPSSPLAAPASRHGYALRSAPAQVLEPSPMEDIKGKGKATDIKPTTTGGKRRRKENSAALANAPLAKRLRSNSTPASLTSLSVTTSLTRSRRGVPRPHASPPSSALSNGKGKAKVVEPAPLQPISEDSLAPPSVKRPSMRALRSNSTVPAELSLAPPPTHRRTRSRGSANEDEAGEVESKSRSTPPTPTKGRGRGRGGRARGGVGRGRGRKRVDIIEASPKSSDEDKAMEEDVPEMVLDETSSTVAPTPLALASLPSPKEAASSRSQTPLSVPSRPHTPTPASTPVVDNVPTRPNTPEPTVIVTEQRQDTPELQPVQPTPVTGVETFAAPAAVSCASSEEVSPSTPSPSSSVSESSTLVEHSPPSTECVADNAVPLAPAASQRPPLRLRIPGDDAETTQQTWEAYMANANQQQQHAQQQLNASSFSPDQASVSGPSEAQTMQDPNQVPAPMLMDPAPVSQDMGYQQQPQPGYQQDLAFQQMSAEDQMAYDQAYQQQLAQQQQQMAQQQQMQQQQVQRRQTAPGLWEVACKIRVCELERRYSWITIRDLVNQEATEYAMRHGMPRSWWRVPPPPPQLHPQSRSASPSSMPANLPSVSIPTNDTSDGALRASSTTPDPQEEDDGEDWSDYESEFSDAESDGKISRESSKGNSPVDSAIEAAVEKSVSPSNSPRRKKRKTATTTPSADVASSSATTDVPNTPAPTPPPIPFDFSAASDDAAKKRRRSWPGEYGYDDEDIDMDDDDDDSDDDEEDEDADAEGEIDPDAWHDPSFQVVAQPVDLDIDADDVEDSEDKENAAVPAKDAQEGREQTTQGKTKTRRMKTPVVEVGGTMSAFYVPPMPPSPPMTTTSLPSPPPQQHQELGPGLDVLTGGEDQDVEMGTPRQDSGDMGFFASSSAEGSGLSPTSPSSPAQYGSPTYEANTSGLENGSADMYSQTSPGMSPATFIPGMNMMYESTLPVPAPRLATIRVHALRSAEVGRVVVGKGTPVDRRRVMEWANAGSPVREFMGTDRDERLDFFRRGVVSDEEGRKNVGSSSGPGTGFVNDMTAPMSAATDSNIAPTSQPQQALFMEDPGMWDAFLETLKTNEDSVDMRGDNTAPSSSPGMITSSLRSEPERSFEPAPPPLPPSPLTPLSTPPASPLSTTPLSSAALLGLSNSDANMYYGGSSSSSSSSGPSYNGMPMGAPGMGINSAAAAAADFGIGMFGMGFNVGVGVGVGIGLAVGAAGVASGMVNIPPPTHVPTSPTTPSPMGGWVPPPPASTGTGEYDHVQLQQGAFGMQVPGDVFGDHPGSYGGFGAGGSSTLSFALG